MNTKIFLALSFLLSCIVAHTQVWDPPRQTVDFQHISLEVTIDEKIGKIWGTVTHTVVPLWNDVKTVTLDAEEIKVSKVTLDGQELRFSHEGRKLTIDLGKKFTNKDTLDIAVEFSAMPRRGIYFVRPDKGYPDKPYQVWTQGEAEDTHFWFPCYDYPNDRATSEAKVTVRKPYLVIGNGALQGVQNSENGAWHTYHWKISVPHVSYLVSLVIGDFTEVTEKIEDLPLQYFVQSKDNSHVMRSFQKTPEMIRFFAEKIGIPYPYEKYSQVAVEEFLFGGMENISATTLTQRTIHDERAHLDITSEPLVAHEIAHQWWGNLLTCRDWSHLWLNEGFATFFEALWTAHDLGVDQFKVEMQGSLDWYLGSDQNPVVWKHYPDPDSIFDAQAYAKGCWVLYMLQSYLGERDFWRGVQLYGKRHRNGVVTTNDLRLAFEDASGQNLEWFFEQWTERKGLPKFEVSWQWDDKNKFVILHIRQTHKGETYRVYLDIEVTTAKGSQRYPIELDAKDQKIYLPTAQEPLLVVFDKDGKLFKELDFPKQEREWLYQLEHDSDIYGRIAAAQELAKYPSRQAVAALVKALQYDKFYDVRRKVANFLAKVIDDSSQQALVRATKDSDSRVRTAAVSALAHHPVNSTTIDHIRQLFASDDSYYVRAACVETLGRLASKKKDASFSEDDLAQVLQKALATPSHGEVIQSRVFTVYSKRQDKKALPIIREWMQYGKPLRCRIAALKAFYSLSKKDTEQTTREILPLARDHYPQMREEIIPILGDLQHPSALPTLIDIAENEAMPSIKMAAEKAIKKIAKALEK